MRFHTIYFSEVELNFGGHIYIATGSLTAQYHINREEADVGIPEHIEIDRYCDLDCQLELVDEDGELLSVSKANDTHKSVIAKLVEALDETCIAEEIEGAM